MSLSSLTNETVRAAEAVDALWNLLSTPTIDPATLARAIESVLNQQKLDWRTLQLVKEGWEALQESVEQPFLNEYLHDRSTMQITYAIGLLTADVSNSQTPMVSFLLRQATSAKARNKPLFFHPAASEETANARPMVIVEPSDSPLSGGCPVRLTDAHCLL